MGGLPKGSRIRPKRPELHRDTASAGSARFRALGPEGARARSESTKEMSFLILVLAIVVGGLILTGNLKGLATLAFWFCVPWVLLVLLGLLGHSR
jgi:hypothetical protein